MELIRREKMRSKLTNNQDIIKKTLEYYYDYLKGEENSFNFERNVVYRF